MSNRREKFEARFYGPTGELYEMCQFETIEGARKWLSYHVQLAEAGDTYTIVEI